MRQPQYPPPAMQSPEGPGPVLVVSEPWAVYAARRLGAGLGEAAVNMRTRDPVTGVGQYARRHPVAILTAAALGYFTGRCMLGLADLLGKK